MLAAGEQLMEMKLPAFIMSGDDASHSTFSAHTLRELIPQAQLSPLLPAGQNASTVSVWIRESAAAGGRQD